MHDDHKLSNEEIAVRQFIARYVPSSNACGCMGPQALPGEPQCDGTNWDAIKRYPACPCRMDFYEIVAGSFYRIVSEKKETSIEYRAYCVGPVGGPYTE